MKEKLTNKKTIFEILLERHKERQLFKPLLHKCLLKHPDTIIKYYPPEEEKPEEVSNDIHSKQVL
jgi:hypothetical protein